MKKITLTSKEMNALTTLNLTNDQHRYIWLGILAERGENIPRTLEQFPKRIEG